MPASRPQPEGRPSHSFYETHGFVDPTGLSLALNWNDEPDSTTESRIEAMATLMHERTHWLQLVGTSTGQFLAWLGTLQTGILTDRPWGDTPLEVSDFPLLTSDRVREERKLLWGACERLYLSVFGGRKKYIDHLFANKGSIYRDVVSDHLRRVSEVILDSNPGYEQLQDDFEKRADERMGTLSFLQDGDMAFGAWHCMEGGARQNQIFKLHDGATAMGPEFGIDVDALLFPPYSNARDMYYAASGREPGDVKDEVAICVLTDWALNCLLPPLIPLKVALGEQPLMPGPFFVHLARNLDVGAIGPLDEDTRITWSEGLVSAIYNQLEEKLSWVVNPLEVARMQVALMGGLKDLKIPESIYTATDRGLRLKSEAARLRYMAILSRRAAEVRLEHPAFFANPHAYYSYDREFFHELWDPIQPPLLSMGNHRLVPSRDDPGWFEFFYISAIQHHVSLNAAHLDCRRIGEELADICSSSVDPESLDVLLRAAVTGIFGHGSGAEAIIDAYKEGR